MRIRSETFDGGAARGLVFRLLCVLLPLLAAFSFPAGAATTEIRVLQSILENAPFGIGLIENGSIVQANDYILDLTGYSREELIGREPGIFYPRQDQSERVKQEMHRQIAERGFASMDAPLMRRDGTLRCVRLFFSPLDPSSLSGPLAFTIHDITERNRMEEALRESEAKYRNLVENAPVGIFRIDSRSGGKVESVNAALARMLGFDSPEEAKEYYFDLGTQLYADPERRTEFLRLIREQGYVKNFEYEARTGDGGRKWLSMNVRIVPSPEKDAFFSEGFTTDINERKTAEKALAFRTRAFLIVLTGFVALLLLLVARLASSLQRRRRAEKTLLEYKTAVEQSADGIAFSDMRGNLRFVNEAWAEMHGWRLEEIAGAHLRLFHTEEQMENEVKPALEAIQQTPAGTLRIEIPHVRRDGTVFPAMMSATVVRDSDGVPFGILAIARDITEQKRMERELLQAKALAEKNSSAKSDFLATMSHEIRTPMNGVLGMTELLLDSPLDDEQRHWAEAARSSAEALLEVIGDVLDFSKIEAGKLELRSADFDLSALLQDFVLTMESNALRKGLDFRCAADPDVPSFLRGDPWRVRQALTNLAGNAIKFTSEGEVSVRVSLDEESDRDILLRFTVRDTGIGIPEDKIATLFNRFSQVDSPGAPSFGGTGLGLSICKQLAELMGGSVGATSTEGGGSEFWFTARMEKQPEGSRRDETRTPSSGGGRRFDNCGARILLVEDNAVNRSVVLGMLKKLGLDADAAVDGADALVSLEKNVYDLVLMDCQMPRMDGYESTRRLRNSEMRNKNVPVIAITAYAMLGDREKCFKAGMDDYLGKPISRNALTGILEKWLPCRGESQSGNEGICPRQEDPPPASFWSRSFLLRKLDGDEELLDEVVSAFLQEIPELIGDLKTALAANDAEGARQAAHEIKGVSANLGCEGLRSIAQKSERAAKSGETARAASLAKHLESEFERLREIIGGVGEKT